MDVLKINGVQIKSPMNLDYQRYDLDSEEGSGRNQDGLLFRDRKAVKVKLSCEFPPMNDKEMSELLEAVEPVFFELEYPDARYGTRKTITAYVGDRSVPVHIFDKATNQWIWGALQMNFIER